MLDAYRRSFRIDCAQLIMRRARERKTELLVCIREDMGLYFQGDPLVFLIVNVGFAVKKALTAQAAKFAKLLTFFWFNVNHLCYKVVWSRQGGMIREVGFLLEPI